VVHPPLLGGLGHRHFLADQLQPDLVFLSGQEALLAPPGPVGPKMVTPPSAPRQRGLPTKVVLVAALLLTSACAARSDDDTPQLSHTTSTGAADDMFEPTAGSNTNPTPTEAEAPMAGHAPITITIGDTVREGRLWDNPTAHDFPAQLPLTLNFRDFDDVEKMALPAWVWVASWPVLPEQGERDGSGGEHHERVGGFGGVEPERSSHDQAHALVEALVARVGEA
jgi:hypothetical protein